MSFDINNKHKGKQEEDIQAEIRVLLNCCKK